MNTIEIHIIGSYNTGKSTIARLLELTLWLWNIKVEKEDFDGPYQDENLAPALVAIAEKTKVNIKVMQVMRKGVE